MSPSTRLAIAGRTDLGMVRRANEDAFLVADLSSGAIAVESSVVRFEVGARGALLAVSDGMGGHDAGEVASSLTLESLLDDLLRDGAQVSPDARVERAVEVANKAVFAAGEARGKKKRMGATLTALFIQGANAYIAEIGDSRAYILRSGEIRLVTRDQSFVQSLLDAGGLSPGEAEGHPMRNVLLQAIGQRRDVTVALGHLALRNRDCLILCTDGLWGLVGETEIRDVILAAGTLDAASDRLVALANERGGTDNVTVLLAGVAGDVPEAPRDERISETFDVLKTFGPVR